MNIINKIPVAKEGQMVSMDVETFGQDKKKLHRPTGTFACLSIQLDGDPDVYQIYDSRDVQKVLDAVKPGLWVFHNATYDLRQLMRYAHIEPHYIHDTMIVEKAMTCGLYINYGLKDLVRRWLKVQMEKETREQFATATEMTPQMKEYAALDVVYTTQVAMKQLEAWSDTLAFQSYVRIDEPTIWPVLDTPGIRVDVDAWKEMVAGFQAEASRCEDELGINVYSQGQVIAAARKVARVNLRDTRAETLAEYSDVPFIQQVLVARMYRKAVSTYGLKWLESFVEDDGKVYADYHINGTETTRFSCSDPNMQNIPARKLPIYRKMFIASPGHVIRVSDVSQQEPCILAFESQDEHLRTAIVSGEDLHLFVARAIFNDPSIQKGDERRKIGKTINLGTSYGLTEYGMARKLNITPDEAAKFLQMYFNRFPGVFNWITTQRQFAYTNGYVKSIANHHIHLNLYDKQWENNAINAPIQTGAAEFSKMWERKYWERTRSAGMPYDVVARVHDELVFDTPTDEYKKRGGFLRESFQETAETLYPGIPFREETEKGRSWACKEISSEIIEDETED